MKTYYRNVANFATFIVTISQAVGTRSRVCKELKTVNKSKGFTTPCGERITSCRMETILFPLPNNCTHYGECEKNKIRHCACAGGNYFDSRANVCLASEINDTCGCQPLPPPTQKPSVEPTYTYDVTHTGGGVGGLNDGLSPTALYIIGSAAGGVVIIILLIVVICLCWRMRKGRLDKNIKIVENPEYTRRTSGIYAEIDEQPPDGTASQTNRLSTFQPTSPGVATGSTTVQPDDAHEYQKLLNMQPNENNSQHRNGSQDGLERSNSEEAAYLVTSLLQPKNIASDNATPDILSPTSSIPMESMANYQNGQPADLSPSDEKHEYFELEGP